jgi:hypothetical protein
MTAVFKLAIDDLSDAKERDGALKWFDSDGRGLFAFLDICDVLELNAAAVRERLHAGDTPHIPRRMTCRTVLHSRQRPSTGSEHLDGCVTATGSGSFESSGQKLLEHKGFLQLSDGCAVVPEGEDRPSHALLEWEVVQESVGIQ